MRRARPARGRRGDYTRDMPMRFFLLIFALFTLGGCATHAPTFVVTSADLTERTADGIVITFTILADNPNSDALPLRDATYSVSLRGERVFSGVRSAQVTVARYGTQTFTLPAAIPLAGEGPADTEPYVLHGSIKYLVAGALAETLFDIHVLRPSTDFRGSGTVDLSSVKTPPPRQIPGASVKQPKPSAQPPRPPVEPPKPPDEPSPVGPPAPDQ